jgi:hypothetical protein
MAFDATSMMRKRLVHKFTSRYTLIGHAPFGILALAPGQLFWGWLPPGGVQQVSGQPTTSYISRNTAQTAVSLPDFDLGSILNTDTATLSAIARDLGTPGTSPGGLSIGVDAGHVSLSTRRSPLSPR